MCKWVDVECNGLFDVFFNLFSAIGWGEDRRKELEGGGVDGCAETVVGVGS